MGKDFGNDNKNQKLDLLEMLVKGYQRKGYNGSWLSDRELLYEDNQTLYIYNVDTKYRSVLADAVSLVINRSKNYINYQIIKFNRNRLESSKLLAYPPIEDIYYSLY